MSFKVLYRKYRPQAFSEVYGQESIIRTLKNQIKNDRTSHAYLFCGTRGTGKTSTAKLFAKAINCLTPIDGEPCGVCKMCEAIQSGESYNVIEIDAASNNGVDNIRDIREEVKYTPAEGNYKVYIIDEVHMLSAGAFNALLKTLEEPPSYVVFILATTDPEKIPQTVLSRCQRFDFKRIGAEDMVSALKKYMADEGITVADDVYSYISYISDGAMRDALSILEQCISYYYDEEITLEKVLKTTGAMDDKLLYSMIKDLQEKNLKNLLNKLNDIILSGKDVSKFIADIIRAFRDILVLKETDGQTVFISQEKKEYIKEIADAIETEKIIYYIKSFSELQNQIKYSDSQKILTETHFIKLCNNVYDKSIEALTLKMAELEEKVLNGVKVVEIVKEEKSKEKKTGKEKKVPTKAPEKINEVILKWETIKQSFSAEPFFGFLADTKAHYFDDNNLTLVYMVDDPRVSDTHGAEKKLKDAISKINEKLESLTGNIYNINIISNVTFDISDSTDVYDKLPISEE